MILLNWWNQNLMLNLCYEELMQIRVLKGFCQEYNKLSKASRLVRLAACSSLTPVVAVVRTVCGAPLFYMPCLIRYYCGWKFWPKTHTGLSSKWGKTAGAFFQPAGLEFTAKLGGGASLFNSLLCTVEENSYHHFLRHLFDRKKSRWF